MYAPTHGERHIRMRVHTHMCMCMHMYMQTHVYMYVHMYTCMYTHNSTVGSRLIFAHCYVIELIMACYIIPVHINSRD